MAVQMPRLRFTGGLDAQHVGIVRGEDREFDGVSGRGAGSEIGVQCRPHGQHPLHHAVDIGGLGLETEGFGVYFHLQHGLEAQWRVKRVVVEAVDLVNRVLVGAVDAVGIWLRLEIDL